MRAEKAKVKEQEVCNDEFSNALHKHYNSLATKKRKEYERIAKEIQEKYKTRMARLREVMEAKRKTDISKIET